MTIRQSLLAAAAIALGLMSAIVSARAQTPREAVLTNVSYDPTRELYRTLNEAFGKEWQASTGQKVTVRGSFGGTGRQARSVIDSGARGSTTTFAQRTVADGLPTVEIELAVDHAVSKGDALPIALGTARLFSSR